MITSNPILTEAQRVIELFHKEFMHHLQSEMIADITLQMQLIRVSQPAQSKKQAYSFSLSGEERLKLIELAQRLLAHISLEYKNKEHGFFLVSVLSDLMKSAIEQLERAVAKCYKNICSESDVVQAFHHLEDMASSIFNSLNQKVAFRWSNSRSQRVVPSITMQTELSSQPLQNKPSEPSAPAPDILSPRAKVEYKKMLYSLIMELFPQGSLLAVKVEDEKVCLRFADATVGREVSRCFPLRSGHSRGGRLLLSPLAGLSRDYLILPITIFSNLLHDINAIALLREKLAAVCYPLVESKLELSEGASRHQMQR